jgi:hypothetical protein
MNTRGPEIPPCARVYGQMGTHVRPSATSWVGGMLLDGVALADLTGGGWRVGTVEDVGVAKTVEMPSRGGMVIEVALLLLEVEFPFVMRSPVD